MINGLKERSHKARKSVSVQFRAWEPLQFGEAFYTRARPRW